MMKIKIIAGFILFFSTQTVSAQIKTFTYNMVQIVENNSLAELLHQKTKITLDNTRKTVSVDDSELLRPYVFKIDPKSHCDQFGKLEETISCFLRSKEGKLYLFSYNKNRLEIINIAGNGTRYFNIK